MKSNLSKTFRYINELGDELFFEPDYGFMINKPIGIDSVTVSLSQAQGINQVGASIQSTNVQPRPVTISGILMGEFQKANKDKLISVIRPDLKGKLYADDYYIDVYVSESPAIEPVPAFARFNFMLLAPYPYWQHDESIAVELSSIRKMFKLPCNFTRPYQFGERIENLFINIENRGQLPVPFTVSFFARSECSNPKLTNANTGEYLLIKKPMVAGERITVEITHEKTFVTSTVDGDIRGAMSLKSRLNRLAVGDNVLKPTVEGGGKIEVSVDYATEIVGVTL